MNKTQLKKLEQLVKHASSPDTRGHKEFNYAFFYEMTRTAPLACGTDGKCWSAGCVGGELPFCFPNEWEFQDRGGSLYPTLKVGSTHDTTRFDIAKFFGLSLPAAEHLFYPGRQVSKRYGGDLLYGGAPLEKVLRNFRIFIRRRKANKSLR